MRALKRQGGGGGGGGRIIVRFPLASNFPPSESRPRENSLMHNIQLAEAGAHAGYFGWLARSPRPLSLLEYHLGGVRVLIASCSRNHARARQRTRRTFPPAPLLLLLFLCCTRAFTPLAVSLRGGVNLIRYHSSPACVLAGG